MFHRYLTARVAVAVLASLCLCVALGCSQQAPEKADQKAVSADVQSGRALPEQVVATAPEGWTALPASGMRKAAFALERDGQRAEVTIIDLTADGAGELLPNVNRWREQLQMEELTAEELAAICQELKIGEDVGHYVELVMPESAEPREAILGAIVVRDPVAWFVKLKGDADLALAVRDQFKQFAQSLKFTTVAQARTQAPRGVDRSQLQAMTQQSGETIKFDLPEGWVPKKSGGVRRLTFQIADGTLTAEVAAIGLPSSASFATNMNRWRKQVGLELVPLEDVETGLEAIEVGGCAGSSGSWRVRRINPNVRPCWWPWWANRIKPGISGSRATRNWCCANRTGSGSSSSRSPSPRPVRKCWRNRASNSPPRTKKHGTRERYRARLLNVCRGGYLYAQGVYDALGQPGGGAEVAVPAPHVADDVGHQHSGHGQQQHHTEQ